MESTTLAVFEKADSIEERPTKGRKKKTLSSALSISTNTSTALTDLPQETVESVRILTQYCDAGYLKELALQIQERAAVHQQNMQQRMAIEEAIALQERLGAEKSIAIGKEKADRKFQLKELIKLKQTAEDWINNDFSQILQQYGTLGLSDAQIVTQMKQTASNIYLSLDFKIVQDSTPGRKKVVDIEYEFSQESSIDSCKNRLSLLGVTSAEIKEFLASVGITDAVLKKLEINL